MTAFNALIITVRQPVVDQIRRWQQDVNLQLMAGRLARSGTIDVQRLGSTHDFLEIDYLPKRGEAEPLLTDFGGLYAYRFRYAEHSWRLTISAAVSSFTVARLEPVPPLDVELSGRVLEVAAVELPHPDQWRDPQISNGETSFYEVSGDELTFPIE